MKKKRVVITGIGAISPIGKNISDINESLIKGKSGISFKDEYKDLGMRSNIAGSIDIPLSEMIDRKLMRFMGETAAYSFLSAEEAIKDANLKKENFNDRLGIIAGSGGASSRSQVEAADISRERGVKRIGPYRVTQTMGSTVSACLATFLGIKGINYSISSACSTSAHCIGNAYEQIVLDNQDIVLAGGGEDEHWTQSMMFDAMGALSSNFNDSPEMGSRPFDENRDGFVIAGGGGVVVVEELNHAIARGAKIYAEVTGYGATSDGYDMVAPSGEGAERSMRLALASLNGRKVNYINAHGTSTPAGDVTEIQAVRNVFSEEKQPLVASTKSLTGHSLGAAGVQEAIYSLIMMENNFISASANVFNLDEEINSNEVATGLVEGIELDTVLSNSFGFGGTNASLALSKYTG